MVRIVKERAVRRDEILNSAQRLINTKGYERMTIRDILDDLQISNGAVYHYFDSKQALLAALTERTMEEMANLLLPIIDDPHLSALEKFNNFFAALDRYKAAQKSNMLALVQLQYSDDNAIVRQKARVKLLDHATPLLAQIIRQGVQEGVFTTDFPEETSGVILSLTQDLKDAIAALFPSFTPKRDDLPVIVRIVTAYTEAVERVLGVPAGSLSLADVETLRKWSDSTLGGKAEQ